MTSTIIRLYIATPPQQPPLLTMPPLPAPLLMPTLHSSSLMLFSGGLPRSGYGDHWAVTLMRGGGDEEESHVVLDVASKIVDFVVIDNDISFFHNTTCLEDGSFEGATRGDRSDHSGDKARESVQQNTQGRFSKSSQPLFNTSSPSSLVILCEEEVVVVDLKGSDWPSYRLPHLTSPHCSAITSLFHAANVPESFMAKLKQAGKQQNIRSPNYCRKVCGACVSPVCHLCVACLSLLWSFIGSFTH